MYRFSAGCLHVALPLFFLVLVSTNLFSQAPEGINYQAVARTAEGAPLADTTLDVRLSIAQDVDLNNVDYTEIHSITTNAYGLFTLIIGEGTPTDGSFPAIDWTTGDKFLNVQVGTLDMGTTQLMSVPFALYAATSGNTIELDSSRFDSLTNTLIIYSAGDSAVADLSALARDEAIDTLILENDSALQIIEGGDTFFLDLSVFRNALSLDNDSTNELLDSITVDAPFMKFWAQGEADSISLLPLLFDNSPTNERISDLLLTSGDSLIIFEGGSPSDTVDLSPLRDEFDFIGVVGDSLKFVFNGDTINSIALAELETGIDTSINEGLILGSDLALINNAGDTVFVDIASLATDNEVADIETALYNEIDADSTYLNDSIDQVAVDLVAEVNFLLNELADDSTYLNDSIDQVAADLANYIATNIDTNITEGLIVGTDLALINNVGDTVFVDISTLATDNEVADIEAALYNEIDADSTYLNDSIDQVAFDLVAEVNFLLNELADDSTYLNDSIDQVAADLANYIATNIDTNITEGLLVGTDLALINNVGDTVFVDISTLATDIEVADIEAALYNEIDADSTYLNDSIDQVASNLALVDGLLQSHLTTDQDVDSTNELITQLLESGDSLYIVEAGDTFVVDLSGLSPDTLDRIVLNDSNLMIIQTGQVFINLDNDDDLTITRKGFRTQNLNDIFIGNFLTGQQDDALYVENIGIGAQALQDAINVPRNTAIGARSFQALSSGGSNTGLGRWSGVDFVDGSDNVMIGNFTGGAIANGNQNVFLGSDINGTNFGTINSISGGVRIGYQAGNLDSADNRLFIDNSNTNSPLIWGDFANNIMQVGGTFRVNNLAGDTLSYPTADGSAGWVMQTDGSGSLSFVDPNNLVQGDTLGNHEMSQNLKTNGFYLSNDGDNEGILIDDTGNVAISAIIDTNYRLKVGGNLITQGEAFVQNYNYGIVTTYQGPNSFTQFARLRGHSGGAAYRAELSLVKDAGRFIHVYSPFGTTDSAEVIASGDLLLRTGGFSGTPTLSLTQDQRVGIRNTQPQAILDVASNQFLTASFIGTNNSGTWFNLANTSVGGRYYQLISTGSSNAEGAGKLLLSFGDTTNLANGTAMVFDSNRVGIGTSSPNHILDVAGRAEIDTLQIGNQYTLPATDGINGYVMSTDGSGLVSFIDPNTLVNTTPKGIDTVLAYGSNANNDSILNLGYLTLGTTTPAARIDVVDNTENFSVNVTNSTSSAADKKGVFSTVTGGGGGDNYGMYGEANAATGNKFGVYGGALGAGGIKYGIYGNAQGAGTNYAGYFDNGDVYIDGNLGIGDVGPVRRLDITGDIGVDSVFTTELSINNFPFPDPGTAVTGQFLGFDGVNMVWDSVATDDDFQRSGNYLFPINSTDSIVLGNNLAAPIAVLDVWGIGWIDSTFGFYSDIDVMNSVHVLTDSITTDTITVGGFSGAFPFKLTGDSPASNGDVLSYQNGIGQWIAPAFDDNDWDTNATTVFTTNKRVAVDTNNHVTDERLTIRSADQQYGWMHTNGDVAIGSWVYSDVSPTQGGAGQIGTYSNHRLDFIVNNGAPSMSIDTFGQVGIGTTQPLGDLSISDQTSAATVGMRGADNGFFYSGLYLESQTTPMRSWAFQQRSTGSEAHDLWIEQFDGTSYYPRMVIDTTGNVGFGTTNPAVKLQISGSNDVNLITGSGMLQIGDTNTSNMVFDENEIQARFAGNNNPGQLLLQPEGGEVQIAGSVAGENFMFQNGNLGLGTYSPNEAISVYDNTTVGMLSLDGVGDPWTYSGVLLRSDTNGHSWGMYNRKIAGAEKFDLLFQYTDGGGSNFKQPLLLDTSGRVGINNVFSPSTELEVQGTITTDSLVIQNNAVAGYVLTSDAFGGAGWKPVNQGGDSDWDTTALNDTIFTQTKYVGIGVSSPNARFSVLSSDSINASFISAGSNGGTTAPGVVITNAKTGLGNNLGAVVTATGASADNFGISTNANGGTDARGLVGDAINGSALSVGIQGFAASSPLSIGVRGFADAIAATDSAIAIYGDANGLGTNKFAGYFEDGDVYIKDTLEVDSVLKYSHSTVQQGYYLRTNADGTVYADTFAATVCPVGFSQVNDNFCIETAARTTETEWFQAADVCSSIGASLPSWMEWYTGTKEVVGVDYNTTQAWEWIDQASQNNASIAGGGLGATLEDRRKTISADNPVAPTNTVQYRCVYRLR